MSWPRQVLHVLGKDLKEHRALLGAFASLVLLSASLALFAASTSADAPVGYALLVTLALHLLAMILAASLVHADSPHRPDAFWSSRPLVPLAVPLAKLLFLLLAVAVPMVVVQSAALVWLGIPIGETAPSLAGSAIVLALLLTFGMLTGALTRDLRGVALLVVLIAVAGGALANALEWLGAGGRRAWLSSPSMLLALLVVGAIYQACRLNWARRAVGLAALLGLTGAFGGPMIRDYPRGREASPTFPRSAARLDSTFTVSGNYDESTLHLGLELPGITPSQRASLTAGTARLHLSDGSVLSAALEPTLVGSDVPALPPIQGIHWVRDTLDRPPRPGRRSGVNVVLGPQEWRRLALGVGRVEVEARIRIGESSARGTMPFRVGATLRSAADRAEVEQIGTGTKGAEIRIRRVRVRSGDDLALRVKDFAETGAEWALVNERLGEGVALAPGAGAEGSVAVVGLGASVARTRRTLTPSISFAFRALFERPADWYRDARLVRIGWRDHGEYTVRASTDLHGFALRPIDPSSIR